MACCYPVPRRQQAKIAMVKNKISLESR
ncbi:hypothetical protein A2U01_0080977, partial [Trifolium medium]|nr:hypothetical protein [Trifolium medium]